MTCDHIQSEVSRAIDERRDLTPFEGHLSVCSDCGDFAAAALDLGERYRSRVNQGIDRLRRGAASGVRRRTPAGRLIPLAAALCVFLTVPLHPAPPPPAACSSTLSLQVPLFDGIQFLPLDLQVLAWSGEPPLPRRLDQDLPSSLSLDAEPSVALPSRLRF